MPATMRPVEASAPRATRAPSPIQPREAAIAKRNTTPQHGETADPGEDTPTEQILHGLAVRGTEALGDPGQGKLAPDGNGRRRRSVPHRLRAPNVEFVPLRRTKSTVGELLQRPHPPVQLLHLQLQPLDALPFERSAATCHVHHKQPLVDRWSTANRSALSNVGQQSR